MKKVLLVSSDNNLDSGAFRSLVELARLMKKNQEYEPYIIVPKKGNGQVLLDDIGVNWLIVKSYNWIIKDDEYMTLIGIFKRLIKSILNVNAKLKIKRIIQKEKIDIVHVNTIWSYVGALSAQSLGVPVIWHMREWLSAEGKRLYRHDYDVINKSQKIIFISEFLRDCYKQEIQCDNSIVIHNGINSEIYSVERKILSNDRVEFLNVGNLRKQKGQYIIIKAVEKLLRKGFTDFHVSFVGAGGEEEKYEELVRQRGLGDYVTIYGHQDDVTHFYRKADVFIMSSFNEGFGRVTVEAMMSGCLIIGAESGATPEVLRNGELGILYNPEDYLRLADIMKDIIYGERKEYIHLAENSKSAAKCYYSSDINYSNVARVYAE